MMGTELPVIPAAVAALLPRQAQCVALVAAKQAHARGLNTKGKLLQRVYVSYRRLGNVLGLTARRQIENAIYDYVMAIKAVISAA